MLGACARCFFSVEKQAQRQLLRCRFSEGDFEREPFGFCFQHAEEHINQTDAATSSFASLCVTAGRMCSVAECFGLISQFIRLLWLFVKEVVNHERTYV